MRFDRAVVPGILVLTAPLGLSAQQPRDTAQLAPVVVTATRIPTRIDAIPAAVTVLRGDDLRQQGITSVADALRLVPAATVVTTDSYGSQTSLFLRGGEAGYTKVLIDGVPQIAPGGPGTSYDFANLTTDNVDRIEVVRGPVSVLYGSDAVTGVVQIFTRGGAGPARQTLAVSAGTYGTERLMAQAEGGTGGGSYALSVSHVASSGIYPMNNDYRNEVVSGRLEFRVASRTTIGLGARYGDALYHFPTNPTGDVISNNQHQLERGPSAGLDLGHTFSDRVEGRLSAGWTRANYLYAIEPNDSTDTATFPFSSSDWMTRANLDAHGNIRVSARSVLTVGAALEREAMEGTTLDTSRSRNNGAAYVQLVMGGSAEQRTSVTLGARLDDNEEFGTWGTYRAGATLRLASRTRAKASVGTGFREPSFYQNFATGFVHGNPDLKPEHSLDWELGLSQGIPGTTASLEATYFDQRFRDLIDYDGANATTNYFNVPGANVRGVELALDAMLAPRLHLRGGYTWLHARVTKGGSSSAPTALFLPGEPLVRRPTGSATAGLEYEVTRRAHVIVTAFYAGQRLDNDYVTFQRITLPAYVRADLAGTAEIVRARGATPGVTASLRVENVFDRAYEEVAHFPARRRTILAGAQLGFGY